ncbi:MAG: hypothetical protein PHF63_00805 [Herbinix sp.]|nr:hypothetical protein [Herbinix sp.]
MITTILQEFLEGITKEDREKCRRNKRIPGYICRYAPIEEYTGEEDKNENKKHKR